METRGKLLLVVFFLAVFLSACKKDNIFKKDEDANVSSYYDDFSKSKKEKHNIDKGKSNYGNCNANEHENYQGHGRKITICHNGHLITISVNAVFQHFNNHSTDRLFACDGEKSVAYGDLECIMNKIMAEKNLNPNSRHSKQRAFNIWIDEYYLKGNWPLTDNSTGCGTSGGGTTDGGNTGGGSTDGGSTDGGGTTDGGNTGGGSTDGGSTDGGGTTDGGNTGGGSTDGGNTGGGSTDTVVVVPEPTMPVCHNGAILNEDYLTAYVYSEQGDLLIACEFAAGGISYYDIEGFLLDIIYDYSLDANAPDVMFQAFVIWYEDYYQTGNWPPAGGGGGGGGAGGSGDGGSGTGSDGEVIIIN